MKIRYITETDEITAGTVLYHKHPNFPTASKVTVTKVTAKYIVTAGQRYTKEGYPVGERFPRRMLYMPVSQ
jgi:hypothetical protein